MNTANLIIAAFFALLGVAIRFGKASWLISGYNLSSKEEKEKYDEEALCKFMGNFMFVLAAVILFMAVAGFLNLAELETITAIGWIAFVVVIIAALIYANTGNRFKK